MLTEYIWKKKKKAKLNLKVKLWHFKIFKNFISLQCHMILQKEHPNKHLAMC